MAGGTFKFPYVATKNGHLNQERKYPHSTFNQDNTLNNTQPEK